MGEIVFLTIVAATAGVMYWMTFDFRVSILDKSGGPGLFPRIIVILLLFFIVIQIIETIRKKETGKKFAFVEMFEGIRLVYIVATMVYMLTIKWVGYVPVTFAYLVFCITVLHRRETGERGGWKQIGVLAGVNAALVVGVYLFFTRVVNILLPAGIIGG